MPDELLFLTHEKIYQKIIYVFHDNSFFSYYCNLLYFWKKIIDYWTLIEL